MSDLLDSIIRQAKDLELDCVEELNRIRDEMERKLKSKETKNGTSKNVKAVYDQFLSEKRERGE